MNSTTADVTMFTDESVSCTGPIVWVRPCSSGYVDPGERTPVERQAWARTTSPVANCSRNT